MLLRSRLLVSLLPLLAASGCCCPSMWYDPQVYETWAELESGLNETPPPPTKLGNAAQTIEELTGVTLQLPRAFKYKEMNTLVSGGIVDGAPIPPDRLKPYLVANEQALIIDIPGHRLTYEVPYSTVPIYCYVGVLPKGSQSAADAKKQLSEALNKFVDGAEWETKSIGDDGTMADYIEVIGDQGFSRKPPLQAQQLTGWLGVYLVEKEEANVVVAYRAPTTLKDKFSLSKAAEASIASITSKPPAEPIAANASTGNGGGSLATDTSNPQQASNNLRKIGMAFIQFHNSETTYPGGSNADQQIKFSWPVQLLPYLEEAELRQRINTQFASTNWDAPAAQPLLSEMPELFLSPPAENKGLTRFRVFSGPGTLFSNQRGMSMREIRDGTSNTLLAIEVGTDKAVPWIKPGGIPINSQNLLGELGSPRTNGYLALFADGSVVTLRKDISEKTLRALVSPGGLEVVAPADYRAN